MELSPSLASVQLVVIAGGLGTRLKGVLPAGQPKILAPVNGRVFLDLLFDRLYSSGIRRIVLALGYGAGAVLAHLRRSRRPRALRVQWVVESALAGTAGALRQALPLLRSPTVLVTNGDSISDTNPSHLLAFHRRHGARASLAVARVADASRFGAIRLASDGAVEAFREKGASGPGMVNCGFYAIERSVIEAIPTDVPRSLEHDEFPRLVGKRLYAVRAATHFLDIGTPGSLRAAGRLLRAVPRAA